MTPLWRKGGLQYIYELSLDTHMALEGDLTRVNEASDAKAVELRQPAQSGSLCDEMPQDSKSGESEEMVIITPEAEALRHKIADFLGGTSPKHIEQRRQFARHLMKSESGRRLLREAIDGTY